MKFNFPVSQKLSFVDVQHLRLRAGFGTPLKDAIREKGGQRKAIVDALFDDSKAYQPITLFDKDSWRKDVMKDLPPERRKELRKEMRLHMKLLNLEWLEKMSFAKGQLREKMTFFWHDHFAAEVRRPYAMQDFNNVMRKHALGDFKTLLKQVSKHPVMLLYLNARQNRKASPNENFAREVMELFTLGTGQYTEKDIKEAARAFTGWNFTPDGKFIVRKGQHDNGNKTFRGKTGNFDGDDILDMILADRQTAVFICEKLYCYLVHPEPEAEKVQEMANVFYDSGYQISKVLRFVFESDWFYAPKNQGVRIKSPTEYLAVMVRSMGLKFAEPEKLVQVQKLLGQVLFLPPNVAGWPDGTAWIDSSTLSLRMMLPAVLLLGEEARMAAKSDLMDMDEDMKAPRKLRKVQATADWNGLEKVLAKVKDEDLTDLLAWRIFQVPPNQINLDFLHQRVDKSSRRRHLQTLLVQAMTLPEYQLI